MVKIIGYKERTSKEGKTFNALELQGCVEIITSARGGMYATARRTSVATTFDAETCQSLIGTEIPGTIEKQDCEPYEYTVEKTGEVLTLFHRYVYLAEPQKAPVYVDEIFPELTYAELEGVNLPRASR
jgi:hypothetical protein